MKTLRYIALLALVGAMAVTPVVAFAQPEPPRGEVPQGERCPMPPKNARPPKEGQRPGRPPKGEPPRGERPRGERPPEGRPPEDGMPPRM